MDGLYRSSLTWWRFTFILFIAATAVPSALVSAQDKPFRRSLAIELGEIEGASSYEIEVRRQTPTGLKKPILFKIKKAVWKAELTPGTYQLRLRSYDEREVAGQWSEPFPLDVPLPAPQWKVTKDISRVETDKAQLDVEFSWGEVAEATLYELEVQSQGRTIASKQSPNTTLELRLDSGHAYSATVTALSYQSTKGNRSVELAVTIVGGTLDPIQFKKPQWDGVKQVLKLNWTKDPRANSFLIQRPQVADVLVSESSFAFTEAKDGDYSAQVQAQADLYRPSEPRTQYVRIKNRNLVAYGRALSDLESAKYVHPNRAVWLLGAATTVRFSGKNSDFNSNMSFNGAEGYFVGLALDWPRFLSDFDLQAYASQMKYGITGPKNKAIDTEALNNGVTLTSQRRFRDGSSFLWGYAFGICYQEIGEYLGSPANSAVALQYFQGFGPTLGGSLAWMIADNLRLEFALQLSRPLYWVQASRTPKEALSSWTTLGITRRFKSGWSLGLSLGSIKQEIQYPSSSGPTNQFKNEIDLTGLKLGYGF